MPVSLQEPLQVTTHPDIDLTPRVSSDGKWVAYVNRQAANYDIWITSTSGGRSHQITFHKADDLYPAWGPDSRTLVFVSQRSDAAGDIYRLKLRQVGDRLVPRGEPEQITFYRGYDGYPTVSPDGKKIAWVSDRSGREELWFFNYNTSKTLQLTFLGGTHPAWSPVQDLLAFTSFRGSDRNQGDIYLIHLKGPRPTLADAPLSDNREYPTYQLTRGTALDGFPSWSLDAKALFFLRYDRDSNADGIISPADVGNIWRADVHEFPQAAVERDSLYPGLNRSFNLRLISNAYPLTWSMVQQLQPWGGADDRVYFSSNEKGNLDVWSVPMDGIVPLMDFVGDQFSLAQTIELPDGLAPSGSTMLLTDVDPDSLNRESQQKIWNRALAFRRVIDFHGLGHPYAAAALYEQSLCLFFLGRNDQAESALETVLQRFNDNRRVAVYAEMAQLEIRSRNEAPAKRQIILRQGMAAISRKYADQERPSAEAQMAIGHLFGHEGRIDEARDSYAAVRSRFPLLRDLGAESLFRIGRLTEQQGERQEALEIYRRVWRDYPDQTRWIRAARDQILKAEDDRVLSIADRKRRLEALILAYPEDPQIVAEARLRLADLVFQQNDFEQALAAFQALERDFPESEQAHIAQIAQAQGLFKLGRSDEGYDRLNRLIEKHTEKRPEFARQARVALLQALLTTADEFKSTHEYSQASLRYQRAKDVDPRSLHAHRGYIECAYRMRRIDAVVSEYRQISANQRDNILIYALGLALSYQATEKVELDGDPGGYRADLLAESSATIARALSFDYSLVEGYLTIAFNYEMMEYHLARQKSKPKSFSRRLFESIAAPPRELYRTITFQREGKPPRYAERAIHELIKALALNDEKENSTLEAVIAMNLANNYYHLGEYGLEKAYEYYRIKLANDTTFTDPRREALIYERLGHASLVVRDYENGSRYLRRAIDLYGRLERPDKVYLCTKRLALLYQDAHEPQSAIEQFILAAEYEGKNRRQSELMISLRSIAYNYLVDGQIDKAIVYARQALELIDSGRVKTVEHEAKRIQLGFLGLYAPLPFVDLTPVGSARVHGLTTRDERALIYSILGSSYRELKSYSAAIDYLQKKLEIFSDEKDPYAEAAFLNNLGYLYHLDGNLQKARYYFERSLDVCKKHGLNHGWVTNSVNLSRAVQSEKTALIPISFGSASDLIEAEEHAVTELRLAIETFSTVFGMERQVVRAQLELGELLLNGTIRQNGDRSVGTIHHSFVQLAEAQTLLQEALNTSLRRKLQREECAANYTLGRIADRAGDAEEAYRLLSRSRWLALNLGYFDLLWRVDCLLGDVVDGIGWQRQQELGITGHPLEYYAEAIQVVESQPLIDDGQSGTELRRARQLPYLREAAFLLDLGLVDDALNAVERQRERQFRDLVPLSDFPGADEQSDEWFQSAIDYQTNINRLELSLMQLQTGSERARLKRELLATRDSYARFLKDIRRLEPQLACLIEPETVTVNAVQQNLGAGDIVLYFHDLAGIIQVWTVTSEDIDARPLSLTSAEMEQAFIADDPEARQRVSTVFSSILQRPEFQRVVLIPDPSLLIYPWTSFWMQADTLRRPLVLASSLSGLMTSLKNRRHSGTRIFLSSEEFVDRLSALDFTTFMPVRNPANNSFADQVGYLRSADIVHLKLQAEWNHLNPALSKMGFFVRGSQPAVFTPLELFALRLDAGLAILHFTSPLDARVAAESFLLLERALYCSGVNAVMILSQPESEIDDFLMRFYNVCSQQPIIPAFMEAKRGAENSSQLYGFAASTPDEVEAVYAELRSAFERAEQHSREQRWEKAIQFYQQALREARQDRDRLKTIHMGLLSAAIGTANWPLAIDSQSALLQMAQQRQNRTDIATAGFSLAVLHRRNSEEQTGRAIENQWSRFSQRYGLQIQQAEAYEYLATIAARCGNASLAIDWFEQAQKLFVALGDAKGAIRCRVELAGIALDHYREPLLVIDTLTPLLKAFSNHGDTLLHMNALNLRARALEELGNLHSALADRQSLYQLQLLTEKHPWGRVYLDLARLHFRMGDIRSDYLQRALGDEDDGVQVAAEMLQAEIDLQLERPKMALQRLQDLHHRLSGRALGDLYDLEARIRVRQGLLEFALQSLQLAADTDSTDIALLFDRMANYALLAHAMNEQSAALEAVDKCRDLAFALAEPVRDLVYRFIFLMIQESDSSAANKISAWKKLSEDAQALALPEIVWRCSMETLVVLPPEKRAAEFEKAMTFLQDSFEDLVAFWVLREIRPAQKFFHECVTELLQQGLMTKAWRISSQAMAHEFRQANAKRPMVFANGDENFAWNSLVRAREEFN
ncbi:PD40 domain-containing protein, partial [candidate division KSB1 bacterium]|nr:PD40 domain-containing protein [candidate division KSB1 bacterium]